MSSHDIPNHDILICGGGLVGASLALALAPLKKKIALVEAMPFGTAEQPSFDERTTAISNGSQRIFAAIGVWPLIERAATPIKRIHVSDQGRFGFARIDAQAQGLAQLGHVVINRVMGEALWRRLQEEQIEIIAPARVDSVELRDAERRVTLSAPAQNASLNPHIGTREISARLVIAADGVHSVARDAAGIGLESHDYQQTAIVANVAAQRFHQHVAYERFTPQGPLAVLPLTDARVGIVWAVAPALAEELLALDEINFIARLQTAFGLRLGRFIKLGKRFAYPLTLTRADRYSADRLCVVGNAAQGLHPIAGQGFNLGLRDAACLAEVLADACQADADADVGSAAILQRYVAWRGEDRQRIVGFTDNLVKLFGSDAGPLKALRNLGMLIFDLSPHAKDYLAQLSLGAAASIPKLARGASLI